MNTLDNSYISQGGARLDILKFVLALFIVVMHSEIFPRWLLPVPRLAVPLFFMMTSYLFFVKLKTITDDALRKQAIVKYIKRNAFLYLFWCIALLPVLIVLHKSWSSGGVLDVILYHIKAFFIGGYFPASWFILASMYAVTIVFILSKWLRNRWLFVIALAIYVLALLDSNYGGLLSENLRNLLATPGIRWSLNFPAAMIWIVIGKILAEKPIAIKRSFLTPSLALLSVLYYIEFIMIEHFGWSLHTDCFIMSMPLCTLIFIMIGQSKDVECRNALWLRKSSIIIYCMHRTLILILGIGLAYLNVALSTYSILILVLIICLLSAFCIIYLHEKKGVKWLRYAY